MKRRYSAEDLYLQVREKEGRLYPDELVKQLPAVPPDHPLRGEWQARAASGQRLLTYLTGRMKPLTLLELGCGNGWLANKMAQVAGAFVVGVDVNRTELRQAQRLFGSSGNLSWSIADIDCAPFAARTFDAVVVASAIQYFADLQQLFQALIQLLKPDGEIHILDSPLYTFETLPAARERSRDYYKALGFPEMSAHYHHHSADVLPADQTEWLYLPQKVRTSDNAGIDSPFPWIRVRPHQSFAKL